MREVIGLCCQGSEDGLLRVSHVTVIYWQEIGFRYSLCLRPRYVNILFIVLYIQSFIAFDLQKNDSGIGACTKGDRFFSRHA